MTEFGRETSPLARRKCVSNRRQSSPKSSSSIAPFHPKEFRSCHLYEGGYAVNSAVYVGILRRTVVPFIRANHGNRYWFWMDLASAHYANATLAFLQQEKIRFVPKDANPPSVASLRSVEDFWAALKKAVYDEGWEATSMPALKRRIKQKARQIPLPTILRLFNTIKD